MFVSKASILANNQFFAQLRVYKMLLSKNLQTAMRILVLIIAIAHAQGFHSQGFFRTRLNGNRHRRDQQQDADKRFQSIKSLNFHHLNGQCSQPCQRQSYFVLFDSIMEYDHLEKLIGRSIRPKDGQHQSSAGTRASIF